MLTTDLLLTRTYKSVSPYVSIKSIEDELIKNQFVIITDDDSSFLGLLTLSDVIVNPRNIVIDCVTKKPLIQLNTKIPDVLNTMKEMRCLALPVFEGTVFLGAITFDSISNHFFYNNKILEEKVFELTNEIINLKNQIQNRYIPAPIIDDNKQFALKLSHEIRTPINAIIGYSSMLLDDNLSKEQKDNLSTIKNSALFLTAIVDDILSLSKIESGKFEIEESEFKISDLIDDIYKMMQGFLINKNVILVKQIDENIHYRLIGDQIKLKQVLINLITNAIKYTDNGKIELLLHGQQVINSQFNVKFIIKDNGIGIPKDKIKNIFNDYYRIHNTITNKNVGFGLGLAISKKIIELLGGKIDVKSIEGKGSEFSFEIPFKISNNEPNIINKNHCLTQPLLNILLVDDDETNIKLLKKFLNKVGHSTDEVENGHQLIDKLKSNNYDLILLDIQMPIIDGYQATTIIRNKLNLNIPIIGLSASPKDEIQNRCILYGMNGCLSKPINFDELLSLMKTVHESHKADNF